jgi:hypothetical protein
MRIRNLKIPFLPIYLEWHRNLKHWGNRIYIATKERLPYIRIFALFIWYKGIPEIID